MTVFMRVMARWVFPATVIVAAAIVVRSYQHAGDGFSAGVLAGLGALTQYLCLGSAEAARRVGARAAFPLGIGGLALMLTVALAPILAGSAPVTHFPKPGEAVASFGMLEFHTALLFDLGIALLVYGGLITIIQRFLAVEPPEASP